MNSTVLIPTRSMTVAGLRLVLTCTSLYAGAGLADTPLRGNPVDSLPPLEQAVPTEPQAVPVPAAPPSDAVQQRLAQRLVPRHFAVSGVTAIPFDEVVGMLTPLAGKEISLGELAQETQRITKRYQDAGYALSFGLLQEQSFAGGEVQVTVVEGYVASTRIEGDAGGATDTLRKYIAHIEADRPLRLSTLERYLNLMAQLPGLRIRPELPAPQRADGATELVLNVERSAVSGGVYIGQVGSSTTAIATVTTNALSPLAEQLQLSAALPRGGETPHYYAASYLQPLGGDGLTARATASTYRAEPRDDALRALGLARNVRNERVGVSLNYPVIQRTSHSLNVSAGVYASNNVDRYSRITDGASVSLVTHTRVLQADVTFAQTDANQSRSLTAGVSRGIGGLGAGQGSTTAYDLGFTRLNLGATQNIVLPASFGLRASMAAQYSPYTLPPSEQITFGGARFGAGYPSGEVGGDSGIGLSIELNRRFAVPLGILRSVQPYVSVDYAYGRLDEPLPGQTNNQLASAALGLRLSDDRRQTLDFNIAKPMGDRPVGETNRPLRFNATFSAQIE